ncbi:DUF2996 domain-containing protein [Thermosynechococcus sichuanensis E542]|uniref:DUF2996 domain-containing protein n=2 Tax=Thermosynechococcus TaxID=146785 RepID=A0A7D6IYE3_9CYAN|nr:DUF2996 domain-containing protein [Thermosynechococcus vestitus E542]
MVPCSSAMAEETPTKPAKKEKPAAIEDKPFAEFINDAFLPALQQALSAKGGDVTLRFEDNTVIGEWGRGMYQFRLYFLEGDIQGPKAFVCSSGGIAPSTIEPFLGDERKVTLDLLVFGVMQRLNGQKWLGGN